jgi:hypothetical protein
MGVYEYEDQNLRNTHVAPQSNFNEDEDLV